MMYQIEQFVDGQWKVWSEHSQLVDAQAQWARMTQEWGVPADALRKVNW